jgi:hypothetical protein
LNTLGPLAGGKDRSEEKLLMANVLRTPFGNVGAGAAPSFSLGIYYVGIERCRTERIEEQTPDYMKLERFSDQTDPLLSVTIDKTL